MSRDACFRGKICDIYFHFSVAMAHQVPILCITRSFGVDSWMSSLICHGLGVISFYLLYVY